MHSLERLTVAYSLITKHFVNVLTQTSDLRHSLEYLCIHGCAALHTQRTELRPSVEEVATALKGLKVLVCFPSRHS